MAYTNFPARDDVKLNHLKSTLEIPHYVTSTSLCHRSSTSHSLYHLFELPFFPLFLRCAHHSLHSSGWYGTTRGPNNRNSIAGRAVIDFCLSHLILTELRAHRLSSFEYPLPSTVRQNHHYSLVKNIWIFIVMPFTLCNFMANSFITYRHVTLCLLFILCLLLIMFSKHRPLLYAFFEISGGSLNWRLKICSLSVLIRAFPSLLVLRCSLVAAMMFN